MSACDPSLAPADQRRGAAGRVGGGEVLGAGLRGWCRGVVAGGGVGYRGEFLVDRGGGYRRGAVGDCQIVGSESAHGADSQI